MFVGDGVGGLRAEDHFAAVVRERSLSASVDLGGGVQGEVLFRSCFRLRVAVACSLRRTILCCRCLSQSHLLLL